MNFTDYLIEEYLNISENLQTDFDKYYSNKLDQNTFLELVSMDPTYKGNGQMTDNKGNYTRWIIDRYLKKNISEDDFGHVKDCLERFEKDKRFLQNKDINSYKTLSELDSMLKDAEDAYAQKDKPSSRIAKDLKQSNAAHDYDIIYKDDEWTCYVPHTYEASVKLGSGTTWCTAYEGDSTYYKGYTDRFGGEYVIIINNKDNTEKYQLHDASKQFMDKKDKDITKNTYEIYRLFYEPESKGLSKFLKENCLKNYQVRYLTDREISMCSPDFQPEFEIRNGTLIKTYLGINPKNEQDTVEIPSSVTDIGDFSFFGCESIKNILIPDSVTRIGWGAFKNCTRLTKIELPNSIISICAHAFENCTELSSVKISNSVKDIGEGAFSDCIKLKNITIPDSVTSIGEGAFGGCTNLTAAVITNNITNIEDHMFINCTSLTSFTIPEKVTVIGSNAFGGCSGLTSITIPDSVTIIEDWAFCDCSDLTSIQIPEEVNYIGEYAFRGCTALTNINIPKNIISIEEGTFVRCKNLTNIVIPTGVHDIINSAFYGCNGLKNITIPDSVSYFEDGVFSRCSPNLIVKTNNKYVQEILDSEGIQWERI